MRVSNHVTRKRPQQGLVVLSLVVWCQGLVLHIDEIRYLWLSPFIIIIDIKSNVSFYCNCFKPFEINCHAQHPLGFSAKPRIGQVTRWSHTQYTKWYYFLPPNFFLNLLFSVSWVSWHLWGLSEKCRAGVWNVSGMCPILFDIFFDKNCFDAGSWLPTLSFSLSCFFFAW